jgi:hypothetical protein
MAATGDGTTAKLELTFDQITEAIDQLPYSQQIAILDLLKQRLREQRRAELLADIDEARAEARSGRARIMTPEEIIKDALS